MLHQALATRGQGQGRRRPLAQLAAPLGQAQLQQQKLIKHQAATACLQLLLAAGPMDLGERLRAAHQLLAAAQGLRQGIGPAIHQGNHGFHHLAQPVCTQSFSEAVNRQEPADRFGAHRRLGRLQHLHQRILKRRPIGGFLDQATDRNGGSNWKQA